ncbi:hypothetical protein C8J57DRAFT_1582643 [Mycena rebaudengoi]|nr:hypothetical protein C8J57DRAFT_1582643 [Mycena rebaudengoi]
MAGGAPLILVRGVCWASVPGWSSQNSDGSSSSCSSDDAEEVQRQFFPAFETHDSDDEQQVDMYVDALQKRAEELERGAAILRAQIPHRNKLWMSSVVKRNIGGDVSKMVADIRRFETTSRLELRARSAQGRSDVRCPGSSVSSFSPPPSKPSAYSAQQTRLHALYKPTAADSSSANLLSGRSPPSLLAARPTGDILQGAQLLRADRSPAFLLPAVKFRKSSTSPPIHRSGARPSPMRRPTTPYTTRDETAITITSSRLAGYRTWDA